MIPNHPSPSPFAHHLLKVWDKAISPSQPAAGPPSQAPVATNHKSPLQTVKEAAKAAEVLNRQLHLVDRIETVLCEFGPEFFTDDPAFAKPREEFLDSISGLRHLRFIIFVDDVENIAKMLPDDMGSRFPNICLALQVNSADESELARIEEFKKLQAAHLMIHLGPESHPIDLAGKLDGIDWVVNNGGPLPSPGSEDLTMEWSLALKDECRHRGVPFFFHSDGQLTELEGKACSDHPFGNKVDLTRDPLPGSRLNPGLWVPTLDTVAPVVTGDGGTDAETVPVILDDPMDDREDEPTLAPAPSESPKPPAPPESPVFKSDKAKTSKTPRADAQHVEVYVVTNDSAALIQQPAESAAKGMSELDRQDFQRLHSIVRDGRDSFFEYGLALDQIRVRELWRAGDYKSWDDFCQRVLGITRGNANRLIGSAGIARVIAGAKVMPIGITPSSELLPRSESQIRPLLRIKDQARLPELWSLAVERAGGQPTASMVQQVVVEALANQDTPHTPAPTPTPTKKERRIDLMARLKDAVTARDWDAVDLVVTELDQCI